MAGVDMKLAEVEEVRFECKMKLQVHKRRKMMKR